MASTPPIDYLDYLSSPDFRNGRGAPPAGLDIWLRQSMQAGAAALRPILSAAASDDTLAGQWLDLVPPELWPGFARLSPRDTDEVDRMLRLSSDVTDLFALSVDATPPSPLDRTRWLLLFTWLFAPQRAYTAAKLASALVARLAHVTGSQIPPALAIRVREQTGIDIGVPNVAASDPSLTPMQITHAGAVLVWPFLPRLWDMLSLVEAAGEGHPKGSRFVSDAAAERAVLLLHYLVSGHDEAPEPHLTLHKLLCGVALNAPVARRIDVTEHEREIIDQLLVAMIQHWSALGHTSPAGLRETFLQRAGRLSMGENGWHLDVQRSAFDVLLNRLPWGIATVQLSWMPLPLWVQWT